MCCRYWLDESPELRSIVEEMNRSPLARKWQAVSPITTSGEIRPTNVVPVIASNKRGLRSVYPMKWGFTGKTLLMNARVETAADKPMFQEAWAAHRCIVPASYYFEWAHTVDDNGKQRIGDKYLLHPKGSSVTWLCGLYRIEKGLPVFVILTRAPSEGIRFLHDRMPLMLPTEYVDAWIRPDARPEEILAAALTEIAFEKEAEK